MKHKWIVWLTAAVLAVLSVTAAAAAVNFTEEPTGGDTVYIAGNPDAYPIEYYDAESAALLDYYHDHTYAEEEAGNE